MTTKRVRAENLQRFHVESDMLDVSAFLDEQGHSRVILNGKVQPVRNSPFTVLHPSNQQTLNFEALGEYVDMREERNRQRFPELIEKRVVAKI